MNIEDVMQLAPVIPVLVVDDPSHARPIAEVLVAAGLPALEVTLRTDAALETIAEMSKVAGAVVGAGTVTNSSQLDQALAAGARFIVSPGLTAAVAKSAFRADVPYLPGISTASDIMLGLEIGLDHFKFFPAEAAGGVDALLALTSPFFRCSFCPTGGISMNNAAKWLSLPRVTCVGGSWIVPAGEPDLNAIHERALMASRLRNL